jgi:hypothetical protein
MGTSRFLKRKNGQGGSNLFSHDLFGHGEALRIVDNRCSAHDHPLNIFQNVLRKRAKTIFRD